MTSTHPHGPLGTEGRSETCARFGVSQATFGRKLRSSATGLEKAVVRLPSFTGLVKVRVRAFEAWLEERRQRKQRRGEEGGT